MKKFILLRWLLGLGLLALLLLHLGGDYQGALRHADYQALTAVVAINLGVLLLATLRSQIVLTKLGYRVPKGVLVSSVTLGFVVGSLTPAASGELLRAEALRSHAGVPLRDGLALIAFERLLSFYLLVLSTAVAGAAVLLPLSDSLLVAVAAATLSTLPVYAPVLLGRISPSKEEPQGRVGRALFHLRSTATPLALLCSDRRLLLQWSLTTLATLGLISLQFWLLTRAVDGEIGFAQSWLAFGGSQLGGILSLLPFGLAASDGLLAGIVSRGGGDWNQGVAVAVLVRATITLPLIVAALMAYVYLNLLGRSQPEVTQAEPTLEVDDDTRLAS